MLIRQGKCLLSIGIQITIREIEFTKSRRSEIPAEVSPDLWRKPFYCLHLNLGTNFRNSELKYNQIGAKTFFLSVLTLPFITHTPSKLLDEMMAPTEVVSLKGHHTLSLAFFLGGGGGEGEKLNNEKIFLQLLCRKVWSQIKFTSHREKSFYRLLLWGSPSAICPGLNEWYSCPGFRSKITLIVTLKCGL